MYKMGYAGYAPGHKVAEAATPFQAALAAVKSDASLEMIGKLARNAYGSPTDDKFRKVRIPFPFGCAEGLLPLILRHNMCGSPAWCLAGERRKSLDGLREERALHDQEHVTACFRPLCAAQRASTGSNTTSKADKLSEVPRMYTLGAGSPVGGRNFGTFLCRCRCSNIATPHPSIRSSPNN